MAFSDQYNLERLFKVQSLTQEDLQNLSADQAYNQAQTKLTDWNNRTKYDSNFKILFRDVEKSEQIQGHGEKIEYLQQDNQQLNQRMQKIEQILQPNIKQDNSNDNLDTQSTHLSSMFKK